MAHSALHFSFSIIDFGKEDNDLSFSIIKCVSIKALNSFGESEGS